MSQLETRITKLEAALRPKARVWVVDWFACESKEAAAACVPAEDEVPPLLVDYRQVPEVHPSVERPTIVLLPVHPPCAQQHTPHAHPERMVEPHPLAILDTLKGIHEISDLELSAFLDALEQQHPEVALKLLPGEQSA
jgi:hypothetical protein